jgi:hypothetical protein
MLADLEFFQYTLTVFLGYQQNRFQRKLTLRKDKDQ